MSTSRATINSNKNENNRQLLQVKRMDRVDIDALVDRTLALVQAANEQNHQASHCGHGFNCYHQVFIAVGGTPGSGKSFIAKQVMKAINERNPNGDDSIPEAVVIGMDGYHLSRALLQQKANEGHEFRMPNGGKQKMTYDQLMTRRGAPFTYCPENFIQDLKQVKEKGEGSFPIYSREHHDPISHGVSINQQNKIILVEGLYLLCLDDPEWGPLQELWDDTWFIDVSMEETKQRLITRHLKTWNDQKTKYWGGDDEAAAARKAEANDLKNADFVRKHSLPFANLIINNETIPEDDTDNADVEAANEENDR
jgi:pantothenate kinase